MTYFLIAVFVLCLALAWHKPPLAIAVVIILWPAYLIRGDILSIPTTALEMSLYGAAVGTLINIFAHRRRPRVRANPWVIILTILWTAAWVFSTIFAADRQAAFGAVKAWCLDPILFAVILWVVGRTSAAKKLFIRAAVFSASVVALAGIYQILFARSTLQDGRLSSFFHPVANYAAMFLAPLFVFGLSLVISRVFSRIWLMPLAVIAVALLATLSYGGYLGVAAGALVIWVFLPRSASKKKIGIAALAIGVLFVALLSTTSNFRQHFSEGRSSGLVRTQIWVTSWAIITKHPVLGIGPNNFETAYRREIPKHYFPPLEWLVAKPHNLYLNLWLETGILGLITFGVFIVWWFLRMRRLYRLPRPLSSVAQAACASLVTILAHGLVDTPYFKNDLALIFVFILILPWIFSAPEENQ